MKFLHRLDFSCTASLQQESRCAEKVCFVDKTYTAGSDSLTGQLQITILETWASGLGSIKTRFEQNALDLKILQRIPVKVRISHLTC